jgi:hypothetical protein
MSLTEAALFRAKEERLGYEMASTEADNLSSQKQTETPSPMAHWEKPL